MATRFIDHLLEGDHASRPAFGAVPQGTLYACSDHALIYQSDGSTAWSTWADLSGTGGSGIPDTIFDAKGDIIAATAADTAARLAAGADGQGLIYRAGATAGIEAVEVLPWTIQLLPFLYGGTTGFGISGNDDTLVLGIIGQSSGTQNDEIFWDIILAKGTWAFDLHHNQSTNRGIYSIQLDTVEQATIDGYNGTPTANVISSATGISIATSGKRRFKLKMATKHASSSGYYAAFSMCQWRRTA